jgi:uncharacterized protein YraI
MASAAFDGWTIRDTSQRAGPGPDYPRIGFIPAGVHVRIFGCLRGIEFCDVGWRGDRGWVRGSALAGIYRGRRVPLVRFYVQLGVPFIGFNFGYWNDHYRDRPFFHQRDRWWKDGDRHEGDRDRSDWRKQSDDSQPAQFPRHKKWQGGDDMSDQGRDMEDDGTQRFDEFDKPRMKHNRDRDCGPQSDNPNCD